MKFTVVKQIHACFASCSSSDVGLERTIELPFAPYKGLEIGEEVVEQVAVDWDGTVTVYVQSDQTFYDKGLREKGGKHYDKEPEFIELVEEYLSQGWRKEK